METSDLWEETLLPGVESRFAITIFGAQFVITFGGFKML